MKAGEVTQGLHEAQRLGAEVQREAVNWGRTSKRDWKRTATQKDKNCHFTNAGEDVWEKRKKTLMQHWRKVNAATMEKSMKLPQNITTIMIFLTGSTSAFYPKKMKTLNGKDTRTPVFVSALLTIARTWRQPKRPSTSEWANKRGYTGECYPAIKRMKACTGSHTDNPWGHYAKWSK